MSKLKVMDFYAEWCGPCKTLAPIIKDLMDEYGDGEKTGVLIEKINVDENRELAEKYSFVFVSALCGRSGCKIRAGIPTAVAPAGISFKTTAQGNRNAISKSNKINRIATR